jgi:EmrB/QacA subfamily drug resistance transporter
MTSGEAAPAQPSSLLHLGTPAGRWVVVATVLGSAMASIDATVVGIALPTIGREFHASFGALQWVVTGYTLTLSSLLLLGGSLGDQYGRRRIFLVGVAWFVVASCACAVMPGTTTLIGARVLQGIGAALLTPGSLAILQASFDPDDRGRAIGSWSGLGGVAAAAGPLIGGYLIAVASWRLIFLVNLPVGIFVLLLSVRHIPESRDPTANKHIDLPGAMLAMVALAGITFALIQGPAEGWSTPAVLVMLAAGLVGGFAFVRVERSSPAPMLPLAVFRVRQFTVTNAVTFIIYAALGGALFLLPIQLQVAGGYSPLESGVALLPLTVVMFLLSARSGRLATNIGPRLQMSVGPVVVGAGLALLARVATDTSYLSGVLPAVLLFGLGLAITVAPLTATALGALADEHSGLASAVNNDVARIGSLIAVAVLPTAAGITGTSYLHPAEFSRGFRTAVLIAGGLCVCAGVLSALGIRNPRREPRAGTSHSPAVESSECFHCALDATPLAVESGVSASPDRPR